MDRHPIRGRSIRKRPVLALMGACTAVVTVAMLSGSLLLPPLPHGRPERAAAAPAPSASVYAVEATVGGGAEDAGAAELESAASEVHECSALTAEVGALPGEAAVATPLRSGKPHRGFVADGEYRRYEMCILSRHGHEHDVHLMLTADSGDPDLYASTSEPGVALDSADWIAASPGSDALRLSTALPDWGEGRRALFVAVYGRTDAEYTLTAEVGARRGPPTGTRPPQRRLRGPRRSPRKRS